MSRFGDPALEVTTAEFVLVHGMSHGAWCWELVVPLLERDGHHVIAIDLPVQALARLTPQPLVPWLERIDLRRFYALPVRRTYIRCLQDAAVSPAKAAAYAARLGVTPIDLDTAHGPMLSAPEALVRVLRSL